MLGAKLQTCESFSDIDFSFHYSNFNLLLKFFFSNRKGFKKLIFPFSECHVCLFKQSTYVIVINILLMKIAKTKYSS